MRIAIPHWQGRVSPVMDAAGHLLLVEWLDGREVGRREVLLRSQDPLERAREVADLQPDVLICGAISWPLETGLVAGGLRVIPHICGNIEQVLAAFQDGRLDSEAFVMPGCCRRRRLRAGRRRGRRFGECRGWREGADGAGAVPGP